MKIYKGYLQEFRVNQGYCSRLYFDPTQHLLFFTIEQTKENIVFAKEIMTEKIFPILSDINDYNLRVQEGKEYLLDEKLYSTIAKVEYGFIRSRCYIAEKEEIQNYKQNFSSSGSWIYYANRNLYYEKPHFMNEGKKTIFGEEKKEFAEDYLLKEEQLIEHLLFQVREINQEKYFDFLNRFTMIRLDNHSYTNDIKVGTLILYDKITLKNRTFLALARLEMEIKNFIENRNMSCDGLLSIMLDELDNIFKLVHESDDKSGIISLNKISELYFTNFDSFSFYNQIMLSKIISYLYILVFKKYNLSLDDLPDIISRTYFTNFKNSIYLVLKELLLNNCMITTEYEKLFQSSALNEEELMNIIMELSLVDHNYLEEIKTKRLEKVIE